MKYDYVKGYKAPISSIPKDIKKIVIEKFKLENGIEPKENDVLEVDVYYSIDLKNTYER